MERVPWICHYWYTFCRLRNIILGLKFYLQTLLSTLKDITKYTEWNPGMTAIQHILPPNDPSPGKPRNTHPVQYDLITMETEVATKDWNGYLDWVYTLLERKDEPCVVVTHIARFEASFASSYKITESHSLIR